MNKLSKTASGLDLFFKILFWIFGAMSIAVIVIITLIQFLGIEWLTSSAGTVAFKINSFGISMTDLSEGIANMTANDFKILFYLFAVLIILGLIVAMIAVATVRSILQPMKVGKPFDTIVSKKLKFLAYFSLGYGVLGNLISEILRTLVVQILSDGGNQYTNITHNLDLTFILLAFMLFLFSYIFRYGEELQQQVDETL